MATSRIPELPPVSGSERPVSTGLSVQGVDLTRYSQDDLIDLRSQIDSRMPIRRLKDLNLETELVIQLQTVQRLQTDTLADELIPANQKAQTAGQVAGALATLSKLQYEVYSSERLKRIEAILINAIKVLPMDVQDDFLTQYSAMLEVSS